MTLLSRDSSELTETDRNIYKVVSAKFVHFYFWVHQYKTTLETQNKEKKIAKTDKEEIAIVWGCSLVVPTHLPAFWTEETLDISWKHSMNFQDEEMVGFFWSSNRR